MKTHGPSLPYGSKVPQYEVSMVSAMGVICTIWGTYFRLGYLDPKVRVAQEVHKQKCLRVQVKCPFFARRPRSNSTAPTSLRSTTSLCILERSIAEDPHSPRNFIWAHIRVSCSGSTCGATMPTGPASRTDVGSESATVPRVPDGSSKGQASSTNGRKSKRKG